MSSFSELTFFDKPVLHFAELESTNDYLKSHEDRNPLLLVADYQTKGRGQYGKTWEAERDKNLCFSCQVFPDKLEIENGYKIYQAVAVALVKTLNSYIHTQLCTIKWPNDIILKDKKIAGILIETTLSSQYIEKLIIGIGINIHQKSFSPELKNASSLAILSDRTDWDRVSLLSLFIPELESMIKNIYRLNIHIEYNRHLYKINETITLKKNNYIKNYINLGVNESGHWIVRDLESDTLLTIRSSSEVEYVF